MTDSDKCYNGLEDDFDDLLFGIRRSVRYHHRRRRFFDNLHKLSTALSALSGSATIVSILGKLGSVSVAFAGIVAVSSALDLICGFSTNARLHADLARRFIELEKMIVMNNEFGQASLAEFRARRLEIEADEPPPSIVLDSICHNELLRAMGYDETDYLEIKWYQRLCCQFYDIQEHKIGPKNKQT